MPAKIPLSSQKKLLRLISARTDLEFASDAFDRFMAASDEGARYHFFLSMVVAYCRPFTENIGIGSLRCEYPSFPDFADADMNVRHKRLMDLRNKMLGHSSIEGTRVWLLAPGAVSPADGETATGYGYAAAKLTFSEPAFVAWLHEVVKVLAQRLASDIRLACRVIGGKHLKHSEICLLHSGKNPFEWTK
jgi:hypothetical protein